MNWLRNKLRAWLDVEFSMQCPNCELVCQSVKELQNHSCLWRCPACHIFHQRSFDCTAAKQLEQQQREICALRGEVAMLKADREAATPKPEYSRAEDRATFSGAVFTNSMGESWRP